jgi:CheY-like chemotaxis protein
MDKVEIRDCLDIQGNAVVTAATGPESVRLLQKTTDRCVVFLDYLMPGITGMEVLDTLLERGRTPTTRHRFSLMSASAFRLPLELRQFLDLNHIPVLEKPFDLDSLYGLVAQAAAEQKSMDSGVAPRVTQRNGSLRSHRCPSR